MGTWSQIFNERQNISPIDNLRKKYLGKLSKYTGRNVIAYYSGWLQKPGIAQTSIADDDMNAFMAVVNGLDVTKGLDLVLHTPGGDIAATEALVKYLKSFFGTDIRAIVPQLAMSAGTMIACSCKEIILGKHSNLGPIDPQFRGIPCQGVIEEFDDAVDAVKRDPSNLPISQMIISKYHPTFIGECKKAIDWSQTMVKEWLSEGMFRGMPDNEQKAEVVARLLGSHVKHKTHSRHISPNECREIGLNISMMENDQKLQDAILSVHHAFIISLSEQNAPIKIVENQKGARMLFNGILR